MNAVIIIPTIDPDERLLALVNDLRVQGFSQFIVVDDGSAPACDGLFADLVRVGAQVLHHATNLGKGAAIKTGLAAARKSYPEATHVVTVDADGQHLPEDVVRVCRAAEGHHDHVAIGVRDLGGKDVPLRSRMGNAFSSLYFWFDTGIACSDTQTGLRAIPVSLVPLALSVPGSRYEYEMNFLTAVAKGDIPLVMVPICTVYENNNASSHFCTVRDSLRIFGQFFKFAGSSLLCSVVDLGLFALITTLFNLQTAVLVTVATVLARMASGVLNFLMNRRWSFRDLDSDAGDARRQASRYALLFYVQMLASAAFVTMLSALPVPLVLVKALVDGMLFAVSYFVQRNWVFKRTPNARAYLVKGGGYGCESNAKPRRTV